MGLLRFLLAVSVILGHTAAGPNSVLFLDAHLAVEIFFIISGFYITLILQEKYVLGNNSYQLFITNRLLRLYPFYWIVLLLSLLCALFIPYYDNDPYMRQLATWRMYHSGLNAGSYAYLLFTNVLLFFQDLVMFLGLDLKTGGLYFTSHYWQSNPPLFKFLLVPQAWSIGVEITFYLIAPFIVRRNVLIIAALFITAIVAKSYGVRHGLDFDPWTYRFFPFELMFFFAGALAYFIYNKLIKNISLPRYVYIAVYISLAMFTVFFTYIDNSHKIKLYTLLAFLAIPSLFKFTKNMKADKFLGELSYPLYLTHIMIFNLVKVAGVTQYQNWVTIVGSIVLSIILVKLVGNPLEKYRQGRLKTNTKTDAALTIE